tara:strand:+ start:696 stop:851 length:156 start_codon:yes stop_codon:yes gene_type:complete
MLPKDPIVKNLESMLAKAYQEIEYWKNNHAVALEDIEKIKQQKCKCRKKEQ